MKPYNSINDKLVEEVCVKIDKEKIFFYKWKNLVADYWYDCWYHVKTCGIVR